MSNKVEGLISSMTTRETRSNLPKKILQIRDRNVDFSLGKLGILKPVMGKRFDKNCYTHLLFRGAVHQATVSRGVFDVAIVWIEPLNND